MAYAENDRGRRPRTGGRRAAPPATPTWARADAPAAPQAWPFAASERRIGLFRGLQQQGAPAGNDHRADRIAPELHCLRQSLSADCLHAASLRAARIGVGADQVLVASGAVSEETYGRALAAELGFEFDDLAAIRRAQVPLADAQLPAAAQNGLLPIATPAGPIWMVAPRGFSAGRLAALIARQPDLTGRIRLTTSRHMRDFILREAGHVIADLAEGYLRRARPDLSAAPRKAKPDLGSRMGAWLRQFTVAAVLGVLIAQAPMMAFEAAGAICALWFLGFIALRLYAAMISAPPADAARRIPDDQLPVYTIIAALYKESTSVAGLIAAFEAFDYPREKLDIKIAVEEDDFATRAALARLQASGVGPIDVIVAPALGPRTKPKALNAALAFARGTFTVIYDAEDRPEPDQLRAALDAFLVAGPQTACAQASLCIDNGADSWLTRMFTAEYAGQFDVFLPGFARLHLPLPLGGSSNHFRTEALREAGAWDPYNVTEDADLGLRLARFGYRSVMFASTTFEEAPARFGPWLRQRTRWMKGWMQTWAVHMRAPGQLWRQIGARGFVTLQLAVGGNVVAALIHPVFLAAMLLDAGLRLSGGEGLAWLDMLHGSVVATGYLASMLIGYLGLAERGMRRHALALVLMPLYWLLLSLAAWRALIQLMHAPYHWEKTEHGLARTSLRAELRQDTPRATRAG